MPPTHGDGCGRSVTVSNVTVALSAPAAGSTVTGTGVTVSATASANVPVFSSSWMGQSRGGGDERALQHDLEYNRCCERPYHAECGGA